MNIQSGLVALLLSYNAFAPAQPGLETQSELDATKVRIHRGLTLGPNRSSGTHLGDRHDSGMNGFLYQHRTVLGEDPHEIYLEFTADVKYWAPTGKQKNPLVIPTITNIIVRTPMREFTFKKYDPLTNKLSMECDLSPDECKEFERYLGSVVGKILQPQLDLFRHGKFLERYK